MDVLKWFIGVSILLLALTVGFSLVILAIGSVDVDNVDRINDQYDMIDRNTDFVGRNGIEDDSEFQKTIDEWVRAE